MLNHLRRRSSAPAGDAASLATPTPGVLSRARTMAGKYRDGAVLALAAPIAVLLVLDYAILPTVLSEHDHAAQTPASEDVSAAAAVLRFILTRIHKRVGAPPLPVPTSTTAVTGAWTTSNATLLLEANFFCPANVSERRLMLSEGNRSETQTMLIACPALHRVVFCQVTAGYAFCPSEFNSTYEQLTQLRTSMRNCRLNCRQTRKPYHEDVFVRCYFLHHRASTHCLDNKTNIIISLTYDYLQLNEAEVGNFVYVAFYELLG